MFWVPTIAATTLIPTAAEVNAGTDMTAKVADMAGFAFTNSPIATPDLSTTFTSNIPGEDTAADSTLTFYEPTTVETLRTTLAKNAAGFTVIFYSGIAGASPAAGDKGEVWPVTSTGPVREYSMGNDPARWNVKFAMTGVPNLDATLT